MTEAVFPITDYAFDVLGFETLFFSNALGNEKSRRVKEKTGARLLRTEPAKFVNPSYAEPKFGNRPESNGENSGSLSDPDETLIRVGWPIQHLR